MRRIHDRALAVEAVQTRQGILVGPLMNDITGRPELTPHRSGWVGNDYPATLSAEQKAQARTYTQVLGARLAKEGYRASSRSTTWPTSTPASSTWVRSTRISGISSMTEVTAGVYADMPLILFDLRWAREAAVKRLEPGTDQGNAGPRRVDDAHPRDLGALVTRGRLQTDNNELEKRCAQWVDWIKSPFASTPATAHDPPLARQTTTKTG